jgi:hypothetical protein
MADHKKTYRRLPGVKRTFIGRRTYWLGPDHILSVNMRGYIEEYKRFYYRDIQALIIRRTGHHLIVNLIGLALTLICFMMAWYFGEPAAYGWVLMGAVFLFFLILSLIRGPSCDVRLQTAVQTEKVESIRRLGTARRFMKKIRPLLEKTQGNRLSMDWAAYDRALNMAGKTPTTMHSTGQPPCRHERGLSHQVLFSLIIISGFMFTADFSYDSPLLTLAKAMSLMGVAAFTIIALIRQYGSDMPGAVKHITWSALAFAIAACSYDFIVYFISLARNPDVADNQWEMLVAWSRTATVQGPRSAGLHIFFVGIAMAIGISGLFLARQAANTARQAPEADAPVHLESQP